MNNDEFNAIKLMHSALLSLKERSEDALKQVDSLNLKINLNNVKAELFYAREYLDQCDLAIKTLTKERK